MRWRLLAFLCLLAPTAAFADTVEVPAVDPAPVWVAGVHGGAIDRDGGGATPYAMLSLTRFDGGAYLHAALSAYRSTLKQADAALPSTYYVGSLGAGGNFDDWVVDAYASYGRQDYGKVKTDFGKRKSTLDGSPYFAAGLRAGRMFRPAPNWYLTPTLGVDYVRTQSLRLGFDASFQPADFEVRERAWAGNASLRLDRTFGPDQQDYLGIAASHHVSDNGLTQLAFSLSGQPPKADPTPDQWQDVELSGTVRLRPRLWLDGQVQRTFGAVAGDATTVTFGLRLRL